MTGEIITVVTAIGALSNATRPIFPAPSDADGGGITIVAAHAVQGGSTNSSLRLLKGTLADGVFTANGTVDSAAIGGTASPFAANAVQTWTIGSGDFVDADEWLAVVEGNVAAANTVANIVVSYQMGR